MREDRSDPYRTLTVDGLRTSLPPRLPRPRWFRYSNFGAALLGHALAARTGAPWADLVRERITDPLGMHDTGVGGPVAQPHSRRGTPVPPWTLAAVEGAGALRSTAADLARFLRAPLEGRLGWMTDEDVLWHNGGTGGSAAFVSRKPDTGETVVLLANAAVAGPLTRAGMRLARG